MKAHSLAARAASTLTLVALAACSGGSGVPSSPIGTTGTPGGSTAQGSGKAPVTFTFKIPASPTSGSSAKRSPDYLSYATRSIVISYTNNGGNPTQIVLPNTNPSSTGCQSVADAVVCTTTDYAPVGTDVFNVTAYDAQQTPTATSNFQGNVVGQITNDSVTVAAGTNTQVGIVLGGIVATGKIVVPSPSPSGATTGLVEFFGYDADGFLIAGPYSQPVTLRSSDVSTTLLVNGAPTGGAASVTTTDSNNVITLAYSGIPVVTGNGVVTISGSTPTTVQASAPVITSGSFQPTTASNTPSDLVYVGGGLDKGFDQTGMMLFDIGKSTRSSATAFTSPGYLLVDSPNLAGSTLGPAHQLLFAGLNYEGNQPVTTYAMPALPPAGTTPPEYFTATTSVTPNQAGSVAEALPSGDTVVVPSGYTDPPNEIEIFTAGANNTVNPERTYPLNTQGELISYLASDYSGNVWAIATTPIDVVTGASQTQSVIEFTVAQLNSANGTTLTPATTINGMPEFENSTNPANFQYAAALAFDASNDVYVEGTYANGPRSVWAYSHTVLGSAPTSAAPNANEYFQLATASSSNGYQGFDVDPATKAIVFLDGTGLDYFVGLGQNGQPTGGTIAPYQTTTLTNYYGTNAGDVHFLR